MYVYDVDSLSIQSSTRQWKISSYQLVDNERHMSKINQSEGEKLF